MWVVLTFITVFSSSVYSQSLQNILAEIESLESKSDPKCYATASRLEDFMFGTPLTDEARFIKNDLQKQLARLVWQKASAELLAVSAMSADDIKQAIHAHLSFSQNKEGHWLVNLAGQTQITIHQRDLRQYDSIAYSLRALLAVQQEQLLLSSPQLKLLSQPAIQYLKHVVNLYTLAVLKVADNKARMNNEYQVGATDLKSIWFGLNQPFFEKLAQADKDKTDAEIAKKSRPTQPAELVILKKTIAQKLKSYEAYNDINNQLFFRNLQVYFARVSWPQDPAEGKKLKGSFTEVLIGFASDLYLASQNNALANGHAVITESDVNQAVQQFIPHTINEYEDAIFFPNLPRSSRVVIEAYDMDAFRDSGVHWRYLQFAIEDKKFIPVLEPSPFSAELLAENIAQFGVLLWRTAGTLAIEQNKDRLSYSHFISALSLIQTRIDNHSAVSKQRQKTGEVTTSQNIASSALASTFDDVYFTDVTAQTGIKIEHRTSDWLNRLLRSYLPTGENTGVTTIPPAFGGGGVAAGDINNDGLPDVLILSGAGNRLYQNEHGRFIDITQKSGIDKWRRADSKTPGEPRQPLIADVNNDGWQDIIITYVNDAHRVYKNLGDGTFADVTAQSGLGGVNLVGGPATVFDYDNDGLLDIYITYFGDYINGQLPSLKRRNTNGIANKLFKNQGGFVFKDVTEQSGLDNTGWGQAVTHTDFNTDGLQDLIVGNDFGVNAYYLNQGAGKFKDVSAILGTDKPSYTMNIGLTDLNGDFKPDIYISNIVTMNKDEKYVLPSEDTRMKFNPEKLANMRVVEANDLFLSSSSVDSENMSAGLPQYSLSDLVGRGYSSTGWSWDADFFDFDNDGDDDLYVLNGMNEFNLYSSKNPYYTDPLSNEKKDILMPVSFKETNVFFTNQGGRLVNASRESGTDLLSNSRSAVYLDYDGDGDQDVILNNYHEAAVVLRNNSEALGHNWLEIKLVGKPSAGVNLDAIGARLEITTEQGNTVWREVHGSIGYMSVHPKVQHVGLGKAKGLSIKVIWPNGREQQVKTRAVNQRLTIQYDPTEAH